MTAIFILIVVAYGLKKSLFVHCAVKITIFKKLAPLSSFYPMTSRSSLDLEQSIFPVISLPVISSLRVHMKRTAFEGVLLVYSMVLLPFQLEICCYASQQM